MNQLKKYRIEKGVTQAAIQKALGIPANSYSEYENNNREPKKETWRQLAHYFGVSVAELQGLDSVEKEQHTIEWLMNWQEELVEKSGYYTALIYHETLPENNPGMPGDADEYLQLMTEKYLAADLSKNGEKLYLRVILPKQFKSYDRGEPVFQYEGAKDIETFYQDRRVNVRKLANSIYHYGSWLADMRRYFASPI
jgi:transcriptional regulator with XRE-family HTH domain